MVGDDWTDPITVLLLSWTFGTSDRGSQTAGGAAENNTKAWQGINKNKNKSSQRKLVGKLFTPFIGVFFIA
ncbi:MAG: hypothetical protein ABID64_04005 [Nitrospirota bacterium]